MEHAGEVVEQGLHADLVARGGLYAQLWNVQTGEHGGAEDRG